MWKIVPPSDRDVLDDEQAAPGAREPRTHSPHQIAVKRRSRKVTTVEEISEEEIIYSLSLEEIKKSCLRERELPAEVPRRDYVAELVGAMARSWDAVLVLLNHLFKFLGY